MRCSIILFSLIIISLFIAGCTQPSGSPQNGRGIPATTSPADPVTMVPAAEPVPTAVPMTEPQVVTIVHQISQVKDVKDSELLFSLEIPVEWSASTHRIDNPENFVGFMYQTDLLPNRTFYIHTFTNYRSREQNYRDDCLRWIPAPNRTVVTINGLTFDRFESTVNGSTNVAYVMRQAGMNDRGYLSVLSFRANASDRFEKEDFDKVVSSFRYWTKDKVATAPGEEIPRILPPPSEGGNMRSATRSSEGSPMGTAPASGPVCTNRR